MTYLTNDVIYHNNWENLPREEPHQKSKLNPDIYSKTRLQIIRWNKVERLVQRIKEIDKQRKNYTGA